MISRLQTRLASPYLGSPAHRAGLWHSVMSVLSHYGLIRQEKPILRQVVNSSPKI
jgi:hypothetical protein